AAPLASGPMAPSATAASLRTPSFLSLSASVRAGTALFALGPSCPSARAASPRVSALLLLRSLIHSPSDLPSKLGSLSCARTKVAGSRKSHASSKQILTRRHTFRLLTIRGGRRQHRDVMRIRTDTPVNQKRRPILPFLSYL